MPEAASETDAPAMLLRGGTVLTLDAAATVLPDADVLIQAGRIAAVGRDLGAAPAVTVLDVSGCFVLPGLIQGHVHLGQTFFRGLAEGRRLLPWLRQRIWPLEAAHDDASAYACSLLGAAECLLSGTTTIQDIGIGPGARGLLEAIRVSGLRALAGPCLMDRGEGLPAALRSETDHALREAEELGTWFDGSGGHRHGTVLNPRFILSCSDPLWRGIRDLAERHGWGIHTHALEQREEAEEVRGIKDGRDEIQYFEDEGILAAGLCMAHGVWLQPEHLPRLSRDGCSVVHCPGSNLKLGSGIADVFGLRAAGIAVGIGADGAPCNNDLDPFEEIRLAALLQTLRHGPGSFSGLDALRLATSEGARALGLEQEIGSIEAGKAADLLVLSTERPELWAAREADLHDLIVFGASRASVRHVVVEGELLVEDGGAVRLDLPEVRRRADLELARLLGRADLAL